MSVLNCILFYFFFLLMKITKYSVIAFSTYVLESQHSVLWRWRYKMSVYEFWLILFISLCLSLIETNILMNRCRFSLNKFNHLCTGYTFFLRNTFTFYLCGAICAYGLRMKILNLLQWRLWKGWCLGRIFNVTTLKLCDRLQSLNKNQQIHP